METRNFIGVVFLNFFSNLSLFLLPICHSFTEFFAVLVFLVCCIDILLHIFGGIPQSSNQVIVLFGGSLRVIAKNTGETSFEFMFGRGD